MRNMLKTAATWVLCLTVVWVVSGCSDDVKTVRTIERHEQEEPRMVSPGTEVVE